MPKKKLYKWEWVKAESHHINAKRTTFRLKNKGDSEWGTYTINNIHFETDRNGEKYIYEHERFRFKSFDECQALVQVKRKVKVRKL